MAKYLPTEKFVDIKEKKGDTCWSLSILLNLEFHFQAQTSFLTPTVETDKGKPSQNGVKKDRNLTTSHLGSLLLSYPSHLQNVHHQLMLVWTEWERQGKCWALSCAVGEKV